MKLYFSRNPNPRLAVATARHLGIDVAFEFASPLAPGQGDRFRHLNPTLRLPILEWSGRALWEADAIACFLSRLAGSDFWRSGDDEPDMVRWISWGKENFVRACDIVHFERGTKLRYRIGPTDARLVEEGLDFFAASAALLESVLAGRAWLVGDTISYADFRMATFLPYNDMAKLPLDSYPEVARWYAQLERLDAWQNPFDGLTAPELPPVA